MSPYQYNTNTVQERLAVAASKNAQLLQTISETSYATSEYQQTNKFIGDLKKEISLQEKKLKDVNHTVDIEYAQHKKYRDSHMKRLAYKIGGKKDKFEADATREEKEWLGAVAIQLQTKKALEHLNAQLAEATKKNADIMDVLCVRTTAGLELDALYKSIFDGPTPEIPEEDEKEQDWLQAETNYNMAGVMLNTEKQAHAILVDADRFLNDAIRDIIGARDASTWDCWGGGGAFTEMAENNSLVSCESHVRQVEMLIMQAQRIQPAVRNLGDMRVAQMNFMTNVVFDNIFSDLDLRDRIKQSQAQLKMAQANLTAELQAARDRTNVAQAEVDEAKSVVDQKRLELQQVRSAAFERLASEHEIADRGAPPPYIMEGEKV
ncbi:hypothetical protein L207DRAFT_520911 [Hyaloscypha variabilis F]|uniref:Uncharacterized protein n=1 Tax=Hyaloscypha variabilis (strain UAMH 11265 / GT02V1 / F) TaxID=1149755 RepID=A0A2J6QT27_HYAVF|nr:hypothetical protein L207DRAFT_520911 [Hyaloscypha variabilis F]